jgi:catechol 2,3-dioxygenase-like lactoylglutathione lyase family enzyme
METMEPGAAGGGMVGRMASELVALSIDALDPPALARYWAIALRWEARGDVVVPTDGTRFDVRFVRSAVPKSAKNVIHLDLTTASAADQSESVATLLAAGGRHCDVGQRGDEGHVVLADPEGNELCVIEPENSFLAGCGRLGSITCDGSPAVGRFWSGALGWPLVWDQDDETAVRAPDGTGPFVTWGPPVPAAGDRRRLRLVLSPAAGSWLANEVDRLVGLGATRAEPDGDAARVVLVDPDGNPFWLVATAGARRAADG